MFKMTVLIRFLCILYGRSGIIFERICRIWNKRRPAMETSRTGLHLIQCCGARRQSVKKFIIRNGQFLIRFRASFTQPLKPDSGTYRIVCNMSGQLCVTLNVGVIFEGRWIIRTASMRLTRRIYRAVCPSLETGCTLLDPSQGCRAGNHAVKAFVVTESPSMPLRSSVIFRVGYQGVGCVDGGIASDVYSPSP